MHDLALKMLLGDRAKYLMLVSGLAFASLLMTQQAAIFCGLMTWTGSPLHNVPAPIWVVDPMVEQVNDIDALRDTDINRVRSVDGVAWAAPLYTGMLRARLADGSFKFVQLIGLDAATFAGAPRELVAGRLEDLRMPNTVIVDVYGIKKLSERRARPIGIGDTFEINDHEARIVGIVKTQLSFSGNPNIYTTYDRAVQYAPGQRKMLSSILAAPKPGLDAATVARRIEQRTHLRAFTEHEFAWTTIWWFIRNSGVPIAFGATVALGFIVGLAICTQTFYSFVLENLRNLGALKAMGASDGMLTRMLILQAFTVGLIGYGCGTGLATLVGTLLLQRDTPPFFMPWPLPLGVLAIVLWICTIAAVLGIRKIRQLEPAIVFRG
ncbi:MAG TPA: ABC transporter permease [Opitutus sp.]|nr:ABC transporter permease [Opitutus sp.]